MYICIYIYVYVNLLSYSFNTCCAYFVDLVVCFLCRGGKKGDKWYVFLCRRAIGPFVTAPCQHHSQGASTSLGVIVKTMVAPRSVQFASL